MSYVYCQVYNEKMSLLQDHVSLSGGGGGVATRWATYLFTFVQILGVNKQTAISERAIVRITKNWRRKQKNM